MPRKKKTIAPEAVQDADPEYQVSPPHQAVVHAPLELPAVPRLPGETDVDYLIRAERYLDDRAWDSLDKRARAALERVVDDPDQQGATLVAAAKLILERTRGKPVEKHEFSGKDGGPIMVAPVSPEQLERFLSRHATRTD